MPEVLSGRPVKALAGSTLERFSCYFFQEGRQMFLPICRPLSLLIPKMAAKISIPELDLAHDVIMSCKNVKIISYREAGGEKSY